MRPCLADLQLIRIMSVCLFSAKNRQTAVGHPMLQFQSEMLPSCCSKRHLATHNTCVSHAMFCQGSDIPDISQDATHHSGAAPARPRSL